MRKPVIVLIFFSVFIFVSQTTYPQTISQEEATTACKNFLLYHGNNNTFSIADCTKTNRQDSISLYLFSMNPKGFVIITANMASPPVIAYSFENDLGIYDENNPLLALIQADLSKKKDYYKTENAMQYNSILWNGLLVSEHFTKTDSIFQQWPSVGDGWLKTNWTQSAPYNNFCPMDEVTSQRSIAGCPAVAMAQILNFHETTNNTYFDDADDYYHNYAGRQYMIDDDYAENGFPSFPELNDYLDTLNMHYSNSTNLTNNDKAALTFACGVAATQVFTSSGSGTFSVNQALEAYLRFGFSTAVLLDSNDTDLYDRLKQNIKDTLPAHLAIVDSAWSTGHNVVVDGYNTDDYYHLNFGWGGSYNAWYLIPQEIPYDLTVIEGVVVDIFPQNPADIHDEKATSGIFIFPNPAQNEITLELQNIPIENTQLQLFDISGRKMKEYNLNMPFGSKTFSLEGIADGLYLYRLLKDEGSLYEGKFVVARY